MYALYLSNLSIENKNLSRRGSLEHDRTSCGRSDYDSEGTKTPHHLRPGQHRSQSVTRKVDVDDTFFSVDPCIAYLQNEIGITTVH
ncbi:putative oxidoreductase C2F3.05c [Fusarium oxysporum f. sp. albedinis]|nr:putative oxidoreductase C2F3.05c [Fusarium oxysporum f. sp. albedinis]